VSLKRTKIVLFALLAFQLVMGFQLPTAKAALSAGVGDHCAMHVHRDGHVDDHMDENGPHKHVPASPNPHECCGAGGSCQCQCADTVALFSGPVLRGFAPAAARTPRVVVRFAPAHRDEFFRPPIA
jgi:hypothetical protein